jgi:RNA polymerase sigma factor FliA
VSAAALATYASVRRDGMDDCVRTHASLVQRIAYHLAARLPRSVEIDDLIQAGMIGLMEAARAFDTAGGASFETFAGIRIRGAMLDELRRGDWAPRSVHRKVREASSAMAQIEQRTGRAAAANEVATAMGLSLDDYHKAMDDAARTQVLSFDHGDGEKDPFDVADATNQTPSREHDRLEFTQQLATAIDTLPERERMIMALYYQEEMNLREIGAVLGVTESRVCQLHGQALVRLRSRLKPWHGERTDALL